MKPVWIVDDDPAIRYVLTEYLSGQSIPVRAFADGAGVMAALDAETPGLLIADVRLGQEDGIELMERVRARLPALPVIVITAYSDLEAAVGAFRQGAFEFLAKPFDLDEVGRLVRKALSAPLSNHRDDDGQTSLIGHAPAFRDLIRTIGRLSQSDITVLITGETGTGKELAARALHRHSPRKQGPFVAINSAAIPEELLESELFGHEKGAFTGAHERHPGRFEQAAGGTLFLDEIGDMPLALQSRLLRVLAEGEYYRVGGRDLVRADVRLITATHRDLSALVEENRFRADLYHRLKVITLKLPPLRERRDDIPELARHFLKEAAAEFSLPAKTPDTALLKHLGTLDWPGNVRELKHLCQSLAVLAPAATIGIDDLPHEYRKGECRKADSSASPEWTIAFKQWLDRLPAEAHGHIHEQARTALEKSLAEHTLATCGGNQSEAARRLGISRNTLARILRESTKSS